MIHIVCDTEEDLFLVTEIINIGTLNCSKDMVEIFKRKGCQTKMKVKYIASKDFKPRESDNIFSENFLKKFIDTKLDIDIKRDNS